MPKPLKIVLWVLAFALAAGLGAYKASTSDPFPPGVTDPGARPFPSQSISTSPAGSQRWSLRMVTKSQHRLHEGGDCSSRWVTTGELTVVDSTTIQGPATATLVPPAGCPFTTAQVQTKLLGLNVVGTLKGDRVTLAFSETSVSPAGSQDLGGFVGTLAKIRPVLRLSEEKDFTTTAAVVPDGDQGSFASVNKVQLALH